MHSPFVARCRARFCCITVSGIVAGDNISLFALVKGNIQAIVEKWIRLGFFTAVWPGKGNRNLVPLFPFAGNMSSGWHCTGNIVLCDKNKAHGE